MFVSLYFISTVKPFLIRGPQNQTAVVGNSVTFQCRVGGEPVPDVLWRRSASGGNMPLREYISNFSLSENTKWDSMGVCVLHFDLCYLRHDAFTPKGCDKQQNRKSHE